jgi:hypothetical protein
MVGSKASMAALLLAVRTIHVGHLVGRRIEKSPGGLSEKRQERPAVSTGSREGCVTGGPRLEDSRTAVTVHEAASDTRLAAGLQR